MSMPILINNKNLSPNVSVSNTMKNVTHEDANVSQKYEIRYHHHTEIHIHISHDEHQRRPTPSGKWQQQQKKNSTDIKINQFLKTNEGNNNRKKHIQKYKIETGDSSDGDGGDSTRK